MGCGIRRSRKRRRVFLEKLLHPGSRDSVPGPPPPPPFKVKCHSLIRLRVNLFRYLGTKRGKASYRSLRRPEVRSHLIHIQFDHQLHTRIFFFFPFCFLLVSLYLIILKIPFCSFLRLKGTERFEYMSGSPRTLMKFIHFLK